MRSVIIAAIVLFCIPHSAQAQYWRPLPSGYMAWGAYREWPRSWNNWNPGVRYYGPGYYRPFSYWGRNPYYRY